METLAANMIVQKAVMETKTLVSDCQRQGMQNALAQLQRSPYTVNVQTVRINHPLVSFHMGYSYSIEMCLCEVGLVPTVSRRLCLLPSLSLHLARIIVGFKSK